MVDYEARYQCWATDPYFSEAVHEAVRGMSEAEKRDSFSTNLTFGTGGLRGLIGPGTNRVNIYTIAHATEGFARVIEAQGEAACRRGVCIAYDSRRGSQAFAEVTAGVFAQHGIHVYLYPTLMPTPLLSYAVRALKAVGGVMVTASHNPAAYNGYKAYGEDGGQLPPEAAAQVVKARSEVTDIRTVRWLSLEEGQARGLIETVPDACVDSYFEGLAQLSLNPEVVAQQRKMKIVYTPLNGTGHLPVLRILKQLGFEQVLVVPEQAQPDEAFTTCPYPNPEAREALALAIELAQREGADLILATDPDADRMGACVRQPNGEYQVLTGNQIGLLLMDYILANKQAKGCLPERAFVATTIVSTRLTEQVAARFGVKRYEVLTGFKYIGELIKQLDEQGQEAFQFGFEESYGYLAGTAVRDKDAVVAVMLLSELAACCANQGLTLADRLEQLYQKYGYGQEETVSLTVEGLGAMSQLKQVVEALRQQPGDQLAGLPVQARRDYLTQRRTCYQGDEAGRVETLTLPQSDVLLYELTGQDWLCVRPSGTEPKLKIYAGCYGPYSEKSAIQARLQTYANTLKHLIETQLKQLDPKA